jgi:hypothetical protein
MLPKLKILRWHPLIIFGTLLVIAKIAWWSFVVWALRGPI